MFELLRSGSIRGVLVRQVPTAGPAIVVAERFYKFHSFTLECLAFLTTWFVFDVTLQGLAWLFGRRRSARQTVF